MADFLPYAPRYTNDQIKQANRIAVSMIPDHPKGFKSSNFPWKLSDTSPWDMDLTILDRRTEVFRQDEIHTIQRTIAKDKFFSMVANPEAVISSPKPEIIRVNGIDLIYNGHHRLATLWIYGEMSVDCIFLEAEGN